MVEYFSIQFQTYNLQLKGRIQLYRAIGVLCCVYVYSIRSEAFYIAERTLGNIKRINVA